MKVLVIEDEHFAAKKLCALIHDYDDSIEIAGILDSVESSVQWLLENAPPDLLFLDIHLADGSSFEILEQVSISCPIIFTTAYDQYAIKAFKTNSVDYLLKPIKASDLGVAIDKYKKLFPTSDQAYLELDINLLRSLIDQNTKKHKSRFLVKAGNLIKTISIDDIAYFTFEDRTTILVTQSARKYPIRQTLDELELELDPDIFKRANRQFLIGIHSIAKIVPWFKGRLKIELHPPQEGDLVISAEKTKGFKAWLDQ